MSADLSNLARQPWANAEQSLEANLNNPLRSWDGRGGVGAATARKAMRAYAGVHKMFAMSAITAQNRATDEPDSTYCSGAVFLARAAGLSPALNPILPQSAASLDALILNLSALHA